MTHRYRITNTTSGHCSGQYEAASAAEALDVMSIDAGYDSYAAACDVLGKPPAELVFAGSSDRWLAGDLLVERDPASDCTCDICASQLADQAERLP